MVGGGWWVVGGGWWKVRNTGTSFQVVLSEIFSSFDQMSLSPLAYLSVKVVHSTLL